MTTTTQETREARYASWSTKQLQDMNALNRQMLLMSGSVNDFNEIGEDIRAINHELARRESTAYTIQD